MSMNQDERQNACERTHQRSVTMRASVGE